MTTRYPLGRKVNHDPRSWGYRVAPHAAARTSKTWNRVLPPLDQGNLGSCTGNAGTGILGTAPHSFAIDPKILNTLGEPFAVQLYSDATKIDSARGSYPPSDTGSDGLSVAKVLKSRGLISGYQHAFGIDDAFSAIVQGPLMIGIDWYEGMFTPNAQGYVVPTGQVAGGHEFECIGYDAATETWEFVNSWGTGWAKQGHFFMLTGVFDHLLKQQGDIVLPVPLSQPAPQPSPAPVTDAKADAAAFLDTWASKKHVGDNGKAAKAWKTYRS